VARSRSAPGFPELRQGFAATAGIRGKTIVINLPGSPSGARESLDVIVDLLPHAVAVLHGARHD
jgi:molybdopterin biosynthesis enzyme MoaB